MHFNALRQACQAVAPRLERIVPNGAPAVQAILGKPHAVTKFNQFIFEDSRPALLKWKPFARVRNDSPSEGIAVDKNVVHEDFFSCRTGFSLSAFLIRTKIKTRQAEARPTGWLSLS
jgi:hypothetical protein